MIDNMRWLKSLSGMVEGDVSYATKISGDPRASGTLTDTTADIENYKNQLSEISKFSRL